MQEIRSILELIYFVSGGPILAIFAFMALKQIKVAKEQIENEKKILTINSQRESIKLATDQCNIYAKEIIPSVDALNEYLEKNPIDFFTKSIINIDQDKITVKRHIDAADFAKMQNLEFMQKILTVQNSLETFALYFISGVADENIAYMSVGPTFCNTVKKLLPHLLLVDESRESEEHHHIIKLFILWYFRLERAKIERKKQQLEEKLEGITIQKIAPIGVAI